MHNYIQHSDCLIAGEKHMLQGVRACVCACLHAYVCLLVVGESVGLLVGEAVGLLEGEAVGPGR